MSDQMKKKIKPVAKKSVPTEVVERKNVEVVFGSESQTLKLSGHSVQDVRDTLKHVLNIPDDAQARVNGNLVNGDYALNEQDVLEFVKIAGQKG